MRTCFVPDCHHNSTKDKCQYAPFPKTPCRRARWLVAISRADKLPTKYSYVCSCHFVDGIRGINLRKDPSIFKRDGCHSHLFPEPKRKMRKKLLQSAEPEITSEDGETTLSFSSGILSPRVPQTVISGHNDSSASNDLGVSTLDGETNASVPPDHTYGQQFKSCPAHSSTPNPSTVDASCEAGPLRSTPVVSTAVTSNTSGVQTTSTSRKASSRHQPAPCQCPSANHLSGWNVCGVEAVKFNVRKTTGTQTEVNRLNTANAATQCLIQEVFVKGSKQASKPPKTDTGAQTSVIMFDSADHFAHFGDSLSVVKSLLGEVMEWRSKLNNAELKINALMAEISSSKEKINACNEHIEKLNLESDKKDQEIKKIKEELMEKDGKCSSALLREKEMFESLHEEKGRMLYQNISNVDARIAHFTGLPNAQIFKYLCGHFSMPLQYHYNWKVSALSREDQLLLTLMKLRRNFDYLDLAVWFNVGRTTVANVFLTFLDALHRVIFCEALKTVPSGEKNRRPLPQCFKGFEDCRMVIDCTEVRTCQHKSPAVKNILYSNCKGYESLKGLVGIAPNGAMTYASTLYPGSTSDRQIVDMCGILKIFVPGDLVLADKGFTTRDLLRPLGANLNNPPLLETAQSIPDQVERSKVLARARNHVDGAITRIKGYSILGCVPVNLLDVSSKIFQVCAALTNFHNPLIEEVEDKMKSTLIDWDDDDIDDDFDIVQWQ